MEFQKRRIKGWKSLGENWQVLKGRIIASTIALGLATTGVVGFINEKKNDTEEGIAFLTDTNEDGRIEIFSDKELTLLIGTVDGGTVAIVEKEKVFLGRNDSFKITTIDENENSVTGWVDKSLIEKYVKLDGGIQAYDTTYEVVNNGEANVAEVNVRLAPNLVQEYIQFKLPIGSRILGTANPIKSSSNTHNWIKVLYWNETNKKFEEGYMSTQYIREVELFQTADRKEMRIDMSQDKLDLKAEPSSDSKTVIQLENATIVNVITNIEEAKEGHIWVKVEYKNPKNGKIELGWVPRELLQNKNELEEKRVDTSKDGMINLRVRNDASTSAEEILSLVHGQKIFVDLESVVYDVNNRRWIKVSLNGKDAIGYVAAEYLKDLELSKSNDTNQIVPANPSMQNNSVIAPVNPTYQNNRNGNTNSVIVMNQRNDKISTVSDNQSPLINDWKGQILGVDTSAIEGEYLYNMLENGLSGRANYLGTQENGVNYVMIKLGATSHTQETLTWGTQAKIEEIIERVKSCEEAGIPYGYYYYSSCTTSEEALKELDRILYLKGAIEAGYENKYGEETMPDFPIFVDVELNNSYENQDRHLNLQTNESQEERMERITSSKAILINELASVLGKDNVGLYTGGEAVGTILDSKKLLEYLNNPELPVWLMNAHMHRGSSNSPTTIEKRNLLAKNMKNAGYNVVMLQRATDIDFCDVNIMDMEFFKENCKEKIIEIPQLEFERE